MSDFIFPASMLSSTSVDEHFEHQFEVANNDASCALVDLDALFNDGLRPLKRINFIEKVTYRGWMLKVNQYAHLEQALDAKSISMTTSTTQYERAHHLPSWYATFAHLTPASVWLDADSTPAEFSEAAASLGSDSFIIKDYVKSRKHEWNTACFAATIDDVPAVVAEFKRLQEDDLVGGIVLRAFEKFERHTGEARVWWVNGEVVTITAHPDTPDLLPSPPLEGVEEAVRALNCPFVTTDLVQRTDGSWRVVEVGDGQVSDFPITGDFAALVSALKSC